MTRRERSVVPSTGPLPPSSVAAIILCGGESRRFGRDKALATYRGQRLLDRVVECAGARADQVILACGKTPRYAETGLALALDPPGTDGPLAGIVAGLALADRDIALLLAIDLAAITPAGLDRLFAVLGSHASIVPRTRSGLEPLLSLGRRDPLLEGARKLLATNDPAPRRLPEVVPTHFLDVPDDPHDTLHRALTNINTPADLESLDG